MSRIVGGGEDTLAGVSYHPPPPPRSRAQELLKKQLAVSYETD